MNSEQQGMGVRAWARLRGRSPALVSKQIAQGMPCIRSGPSGRTVRIIPSEAIDWEVEQAVEAVHVREESQGDRLKREQADRIALENAVRRGDLCMKADVRSVVIGAVLAHRSERNGIAGRLANELAGLTPAEIRGRILDELRRCDEQFAQRTGAFGMEGDAAAGDQGGEEAAAQA